MLSQCLRSSCLAASGRFTLKQAHRSWLQQAKTITTVPLTEEHYGVKRGDYAEVHSCTYIGAVY